MDWEKRDKEILQVSKEISLKFIETQRISPANFAEIFPIIYKVINDTAGGKNDNE